MKKYVVAIFVSVVVVSGLFVISDRQPKESASESNNIDNLKFSNTMEWDQDLLGQARKRTRLSSDWHDKITIATPAKNSAPETQEELRILLAYKVERTDEKIQQIKSEMDINTAKLGGRLISDYFDKKKFPQTSEFLIQTVYDLNIIILSEKERFDRVRPSILEPDIDPVIEVPGHPAYPSGHATQAYFLARALGELLPDQKENLLDEAALIAKNREIAGVHYPSDTEAGMFLADKFMQLVLQNQKLLDLFEEAKKEWR